MRGKKNKQNKSNQSKNGREKDIGKGKKKMGSEVVSGRRGRRASGEQKEEIQAKIQNL